MLALLLAGLALGTVAHGLPALSFRLDDVQCGWMMDNAFAIIDTFVAAGVPLTVGVVTGPSGCVSASCDCYAPGLLARLNATPGLLEIASHSVTHPFMTSLDEAGQLAELYNSKKTLDQLLGTNVTTFIAPYDLWNNDTIEAMGFSGYTTLSAQCTVVQIGSPSSYPDNMCASSMYPDERPVFFPAIGGITHVPIGAAITTFNSASELLTIDQLFNSSDSECFNLGACSVQSMLDAVVPLTFNHLPWAAIMIHPQDFDDHVSPAVLADYFGPIFKYIDGQYTVTRIGDLPQATYAHAEESMASAPERQL